jgi:hypothetical protein
VQLPPEDFCDVGLDHDLAVEVTTRVEVEIRVRVPGEAVDARVRAPAVGIHRPLERELGGGRDPVEGGLREHLVEGDPGEVRRPNGSDEAVVGVETR